MKLAIYRWLRLGAVLGALALSGCGKKTVAPPVLNSDIPADPGGSAPELQLKNIRPSGRFTLTPGNEVRIRLNLLGIANPTTGLPLDLGASEIFVTEDGVLKGRKVTIPVQDDRLQADVVFVVDNSGSMGEEADSISSRIAAFARSLEARNIDVRVGCVGHGYESDQRVYGALNLTNALSLGQYLGRFTGLARTVGYSGPDSARLEAAALSFGSPVGEENSIIGIRFADQEFSWRPGANRVYVAFTDEPTQPGGDTTLATRAFIDDWLAGAGRGTVHVVFSADTTDSWEQNYRERPWELAQLTGGTFKDVQGDASDLDLESLPVTGVIASSRLVEFLSSAPGGNHSVVVTVKTPTADGRAVFANISYGTPTASARAIRSAQPRRAILLDAAGRPQQAVPDNVR